MPRSTPLTPTARRLLAAVAAGALAALPATAGAAPRPITMSDPAFIPFGGLGFGMQLADATGDGRPDLLMTNLGLGTGQSVVVIRPGNGNATFGTLATKTLAGEGAYGTGVGDLDGDGHPDLVVAQEGGHQSTTDTGRIAVLAGDGTPGGFTQVATLEALRPESVAIADFDDDGHLDLAADGAGAADVFYGDGAFGFTKVAVAGGGEGSWIAAGDVDRDGDPDLVSQAPHAAGSQAESLTVKNAGGRAWTTMRTGLPVHAEFGTLADMDDDGVLDVLAPGWWARGAGLGFFSGGGALPVTGTTLRTTAAGDLNGDRRLDVVAPAFGPVGAAAWPGDAAAQHGFGAGIRLGDTSDEVVATAIADLDGDHRDDVAFRERFGGVRIVRNTGSPMLGDTPGTLKLGAVPVGDSGAAATFDVLSDGNARLRISAVTAGGRHPAEVILNDDCDAPLAVGETCTVSVRLAPTAAGDKSASVVIASNAGERTVELEGEGIDVSDPTVAVTAPADGAVYGHGADVTADFACTDEPGGSGIASCTGTVADGEPLATGTLGAHEFTVTAVDRAGNTTTKTVSYTVADRTAPAITITAPAPGATYAVGEHVVARYACADEAGGSGVATCTGTDPDGGAIDTAAPGTKTFAVTATDAAGNRATERVTYTVTAATSATLCGLTRQAVQDGARYKALNARQRAAADVLWREACAVLDRITPKLTGLRKALLVLGYRVTITGLVRSGWLTAAQGDALMRLALAL